MSAAHGTGRQGGPRGAVLAWLQGDAIVTILLLVALRALSVACSVLTVALVYLWGKDLGGRKMGLMAALLLAFSPLAVYYGREAKGYAFVTLWATTSTMAWMRQVDSVPRPRPMAWVGFVLGEALAVGGHYYALFLPLAQGLWLIVDLLVGRTRGPVSQRQRLWRWLGGQAVAGLLVLPWVLATASSTVEGAHGVPWTGEALGGGRYALTMLVGLAAGPFAGRLAGGLAALALSVGLLYAAGRYVRCQNVQRLLALIAVPLAAGFFVQLAVPFQHARFFAYIVPPLCVLVALGLAHMGRWRWLVAACLALGWGLAMLPALGPRVPDEQDLRPLARAIQQYGADDELIVVGYIWQEGILRAYLEPDHSYILGWYDEVSAAETLGEQLAQHAGLWLVTHDVELQHPGNTAGWWLEHHAARGTVAEQGQGRAVHYLAVPQRPLDQVALLEGGLSVRYAQLAEEARPGETVVFALEWQATEPCEVDATVYVHLVAPDGSVVAQADGDPVNGLCPLGTLAIGDPVTSARALTIPPEASDGLCTLRLGVYARESGRRYTLAADPAQDGIDIGTVQVVGSGAPARPCD